jgi:hypothetical protein
MLKSDRFFYQRSPKKRGTNPQRDDSTHDRDRDDPNRARDRADSRTNRHRKANQPRAGQGKSSSRRARHEDRPDDRARERTRRRTNRPRTATSRQSQARNATEGNSDARRTKTDKERRTNHEKKPPKGHNSGVRTALAKS